MTAQDVARWTVEQLEDGYLYQEAVVYRIQDKFGDEFVYWNENGYAAIARPVLRAFRKLTEGSVVWEHGERFWRKRESYDRPGHQVE
jgi:hypothetical protein